MILPDDLTAVLWRYDSNNGKKTTIPVNTHGMPASVTDTKNWRPYKTIPLVATNGKGKAARCAKPSGLQRYEIAFIKQSISAFEYLREVLPLILSVDI
jgi:hypothetical protein